MATLKSRDDLKEYCLRRLGDPVIQINVDDDQLEDRIDDVFDYYMEFHEDFTETTFEVIQITQQMIDKQAVTISNPLVYNIQKIMKITNDATDHEFTLEYQMMLDTMREFSSFDTVSYYLWQERLALFDSLFGDGSTTVQYNKHKNELKLFIDWSQIVADEVFVVVQADSYLDISTATSVYNDRWIKKYCTALFKRQWGENLKKLNNVQLPGGITIPGQTLYDEAIEEIKELEDEMLNSYSGVLGIFGG